MAPASAASETSSATTEGWLDYERRSSTITSAGRFNNEVVQLMTSDSKIVKMDWYILAWHSPVLKRKFEEDEDASVFQISGSHKAWSILIQLLMNEKKPVHAVDDIAEALTVARAYQLGNVEDALFNMAL